MKEQVSYVVSWTADHGGGSRAERRTFEDWEPALALYEEVAADRRTHAVSLTEVAERDRRSFERETRHEPAVPTDGRADREVFAAAAGGG